MKLAIRAVEPAAAVDCQCSPPSTLHPVRYEKGQVRDRLSEINLSLFWRQRTLTPGLHVQLPGSVIARHGEPSDMNIK